MESRISTHHRLLRQPVVIEGTGLLETLHYVTKPLHWIPGIGKRIKNATLGPRKGPTKRFTEFLDGEGSQRVVKLEVARKPIEAGVKAAMNILSLGNVSRTQRKLGYDDIMHSYLIVTLENGKQYIVHKNEVIEQRLATEADFKGQRSDIPLPTDRSLNLEDLVNKAADTDNGKEATAESKRNFYQYNGSSYNCQNFVQQIVEDNDLHPSDPAAQEILKPQDAKQLIDSLGPLSHIPKIVTDIAGAFDRFKHGDGMLRKGTLRSKKLGNVRRGNGLITDPIPFKTKLPKPTFL